MSDSRRRLHATISVLALAGILGAFVEPRTAAATAANPVSPAGSATTGATASETSAWMPDVAARIASLTERTERAAAEARNREAEQSPGGQWWRGIAVQPAPDRTR